MRHYEQPTIDRCPHRQEAISVVGMKGVEAGDRERIAEDRFRFGEGDTLFSLVRLRLRLVPLKIHLAPPKLPPFNKLERLPCSKEARSG